MTTVGDFASAMLSFGEWPFTVEKQWGLTAWAMAEGDINVPQCSGALWNPWDTTEPAIGATDFNGVGVKNYPSSQSGLDAVYATLHNGRYDNVLAVLNDEGASAYSLAQAIGNSPWGTGNFSWAVDRIRADPAPFLAVEVPGGTPGPTPVPEPGPPTEEDEMITSLFDGTERHVWRLNADGSVTHWWSNVGGPWSSEVWH